MADDLQPLASAVQRLYDEKREQDQALDGLRAQLEGIVDALVGNGTLNEGHQRHLARAGRLPTRSVRLRAYVDKHAIQSPDVDCQAIFPICGARCCAFKLFLSPDDVAEGKLEWDRDQPYWLKKDLDGLCTHLERKTGGCTAYPYRPAFCREYDCRKDPRIWIDFERKILAPALADRDLSLSRNPDEE